MGIWRVYLKVQADNYRQYIIENAAKFGLKESDVAVMEMLVLEALALFIVANNRSTKRMGAAFKKLAQKINDDLTHQ